MASLELVVKAAINNYDIELIFPWYSNIVISTPADELCQNMLANIQQHVHKSDYYA